MWIMSSFCHGQLEVCVMDGGGLIEGISVCVRVSHFNSTENLGYKRN